MLRLVFVLLALTACHKKSSEPATGSAGSAPPVTTGSGSGTAAAAAVDAAPASDAAATTGSPPPAGDDVLSLATGAMIGGRPKAVEPLTESWFLFDEDPTTGWNSERDEIAKTPLVLELPVKTRIDRLVLDAAQLDLDMRLPEQVVVELSDESATAGFQPI